MATHHHVGAGVHRARVRAHTTTAGTKPHTRKAVTRFSAGDVVFDTVTQRPGVVDSVRLVHERAADSTAPPLGTPAFSLKVPRGVRVERYWIVLNDGTKVTRALADLEAR